MTIAVDWLAKRARLSPNKIALIDTIQNRRISYADWNSRANKTARLLSDKLHIQKGDRVAVMASNCVEYLDVLFACNKNGAILQNLNWRLAVPELEDIINHAQPRVLIYTGDMYDKVRRLKLRRDIPSVEHFVAIGDKVQPEDVAFAERDKMPDAPPEGIEISHSDPWVICYTGGSTGIPKGVVVTHGNMDWNATNTVMSWGLTPDDTAVLDSSLFHIGGLNVFTTPLVQCGGTSVVCKSFDSDHLFDLFESGEITVYFGVPTMFIVMQNHERWAQADFSSLKFIISGGAPCPMPVFERFWKKGVDFRTGYGLTEAGPNTFWLPAGQAQSKPGAVGYPMFHVETRLVHMNGAEVSQPGEPGELWVRGPHRTPGYWNNPLATSETITDEGWLRTGDLATMDEDGAYTIVGRAKDMFISGGENVYPAEVESVIYGYDGVMEAAVFDVPDPTWGEVGRAVIVARGGGMLDQDDLREYLRERMAHYKVPQSFIFVESLPKTGAGKIDKRAIRELYGSL